MEGRMIVGRQHAAVSVRAARRFLKLDSSQGEQVEVSDRFGAPESTVLQFLVRGSGVILVHMIRSVSVSAHRTVAGIRKTLSEAYAIGRVIVATGPGSKYGRTSVVNVESATARRADATYQHIIYQATHSPAWRDTIRLPFPLVRISK